MRLQTSPAILVLFLAAPGCNAVMSTVTAPAIRGSGIAKEETRAVGPCDGIDVRSALSAVVTAGPAASVTVRGDDNLVPLVETEVEGSTLYARMRPNTGYTTKLPLELVVTLPRLVLARADGASTIRATVVAGGDFTAVAAGASTLRLGGIDAAQADLTARGASRIEASGKAGRAHLTAAEASTIQAGALDAQAAEARLGGASHGEVRASASIRGAVAEASSLRVLGHPATSDVAISGASSVRHED